MIGRKSDKKFSGLLNMKFVLSNCYISAFSFFDEHITRTYGVDMDLDFIGEIIVRFVNEPHKAL